MTVLLFSELRRRVGSCTDIRVSEKFSLHLQVGSPEDGDSMFLRNVSKYL
jgi:hypothetical protein